MHVFLCVCVSMEEMVAHEKESETKVEDMCREGREGERLGLCFVFGCDY